MTNEHMFLVNSSRVLYNYIFAVNSVPFTKAFPTMDIEGGSSSSTSTFERNYFGKKMGGAAAVRFMVRCIFSTTHPIQKPRFENAASDPLDCE